MRSVEWKHYIDFLSDRERVVIYILEILIKIAITLS